MEYGTWNMKQTTSEMRFLLLLLETYLHMPGTHLCCTHFGRANQPKPQLVILLTGDHPRRSFTICFSLILVQCAST